MKMNKNVEYMVSDEGALLRRPLAHIELVREVRPIEGADRLELAIVLGWYCVVVKDTVKAGDKVLYIEIDSRVPETPAFEFMRQKDFKVKTIKLRGQVSQGLTLSLKDFPELQKCNVGDDVTDILGIKKIISSEEKEIKKRESVEFKGFLNKMKTKKWFKYLMRYKWFRKLVLSSKSKHTDSFPSFVEKTDEERIQNIPRFCEENFRLWDATEKLNGTSTTFILKKEKNKWIFHICSRNLTVFKDDVKKEVRHIGDRKAYVTFAIESDIKSQLLDLVEKENIKHELVIQGELIGPGIQSNEYNLDKLTFRVFNLVIDRVKKGVQEGSDIVEKVGLHWCPILYKNFKLLPLEDLILLTDGYSRLNPNQRREGLVFRSTDNSQSFKVISFSYQLGTNPNMIEKGKLKEKYGDEVKEIGEQQDVIQIPVLRKYPLKEKVNVASVIFDKDSKMETLLPFISQYSNFKYGYILYSDDDKIIICSHNNEFTEFTTKTLGTKVAINGINQQDTNRVRYFILDEGIREIYLNMFEWVSNDTNKYKHDIFVEKDNIGYWFTNEKMKKKSILLSMNEYVNLKELNENLEYFVYGDHIPINTIDSYLKKRFKYFHASIIKNTDGVYVFKLFKNKKNIVNNGNEGNRYFEISEGKIKELTLLSSVSNSAGNLTIPYQLKVSDNNDVIGYYFDYKEESK